jgi:hypothetical protein
MNRVMKGIMLAAALILMSYSPLCASTIDNDIEGAICLQESRKILATLGVTVEREILLKVRPRQEVQVHFVSSGGRSISVGGYYQAFSPETIWIVAGLDRNRTIADIAHELAHAWQSTNCPPQDRTITEGFATWCGHKTLLYLGERQQAARLEALDDEDYGRGLKLFLSIEAKGGPKAVLDFAKTAVKVPEGHK